MSDPKRFHPYSQNAQKMGRLSLSKNALKTSSSKRTPLSVLNTYANDPVYEHKSYLNQSDILIFYFYCNWPLTINLSNRKCVSHYDKVKSGKKGCFKIDSISE